MTIVAVAVSRTWLRDHIIMPEGKNGQQEKYVRVYFVNLNSIIKEFEKSFGIKNHQIVCFHLVLVVFSRVICSKSCISYNLLTKR